MTKFLLHDIKVTDHNKLKIYFKTKGYLEVGMKKSGEIQKRAKGRTSAKYDSRSAEFKQEQKKAKEAQENGF